MEANIIERTSEGNKYGKFTTRIIRIIDDSIEESNSFMSRKELAEIIEENNFTKIVPYIILELNTAEDTSKIVKEINDTKKYIALLQSEMLEMVITFIRIIQGLLIVMLLQAIIVSIVMIGVILYMKPLLLTAFLMYYQYQVRF